ncbi:MAG: 23S rRNA (uracil-5-)-methyltransferase RumA [Clostridiales bacterium 43-6]|nr:MAG: 23S rRNA (uracil-5-)-methyltransferase RumA [Clostridiales bacterium 43-6]
MNKNDIVTIEITGITAEGSGVGRHEGMAVFVPNTIEGEVVQARILKLQKNFAHGKIEEILKKSPDRIESDCEVYHKCGGCTYRHMNYEAECAIKYNRVSDTLKRIGKIDIVPEPILGGEDIKAYRNKAQFPVGMDENGKLQIGFYAERSHRIVDFDSCGLHPPEFTTVVKVMREYIAKSSMTVYSETTKRGLLRHIYVRKAFATGEIMVCLVINSNRIKEEVLLTEMLTRAVPAIKTIVLNKNKADTNVILGKDCRTIYGTGYITDVLCGLQIKLSPLSFYQVNSVQAEKLYAKAKEYADPKDKTVLDLYCGAGTIGLTMADSAKEIIGVEIIPEAVKDAIENAAQNNIKNARFLCDDAAGAAENLAKEGIRPDVVLLDPPRKGCDQRLIETVAEKMTPDQIVYVSCDPATLARDCGLFEEKGYQVIAATPVDLFPRTKHVECVVLMSRVKE